MSSTVLKSDAWESFAAEIGEFSDPSRLRAAIVGAFQRRMLAASCVFFELDDWTGRLLPAFDVGRDRRPSPLGFLHAGALARWLRVNDELLVVPDRRNVWDYLGADEQGELMALDARACLPLVADAELVAFIALCDTDRRPALGEHRIHIERCARQAAVRWRDVVRLARERTRDERLRRSQQLGVAGQMAASVAHEVRNPLAAVRSLVQYAREMAQSTAERGEILGDVLQEVDRIDRTLTNLLQLSQPTSPDRRVVDVTALLESVTRFVRAYGSRRRVSVQLGVTTPGLTVLGDERELRQVVTNLLLNAFQACEGPGDVTASVTRIDDGAPEVDIRIVDSGQGITASDLDRVFEPFFTTRPGGTGLGLPFCRDAIERLGGRMAIQSSPGLGTTVQVRLPLLVTNADDSSR